MNDLIERVRALMEERGIKPAQLCRELHMSASTFTDWGKGKGTPSLKAVTNFAEYFDVSMDYLVFGRESQEPVQYEVSVADTNLLHAFHQLSPELQQKAVSYIEGMAAAMPESSSMSSTQ